MSTDKPVALENAEARRLINQWSSQGFFRVRGLGGRIALEEITPRSSYTVRLQTQYEDRKVAPTSVPYHGGPVDNYGRPPGAWDLPVQPPANFEDRTETIALPHTERVHTCTRCNGLTTVTCSPCQGSGKVNCTFCNGKGYRERTQTRTETNEHGHPVVKNETVRDECTCIMGKVQCTSCSGMGGVTCSGCQGSGRVKTFDQLTVHFHCPGQTEVLHGTKMPEALLGRASGEVLVDERAAPVVACPAIAPEVDKQIHGLLQQTQAVSEKTTRIHFQQLQVVRVNVQEIVYRYHGSATKQLWIYGQEQHIYAPGTPRPWAKLMLILGGIVAGLIGLIGLIVGLASR